MPTPTLKGKAGRYQRIVAQLEELLAKPGNDLSRMATIVATLHHKLPDFFWTGFYLLKEPLEGEAGADNGAVKNDKGDGVKVERDLIVGPYQGPVACQTLERHQGVCWAAIDREETVVVPDVHAFPSHIACDARSNSEIVVPLRRPVSASTGGGKAGAGSQVHAGGEALGEAGRACLTDSEAGQAGSEESQIVGVLDIDSEKLGTFDDVDAQWLERIVAMVYPEL